MGSPSGLKSILKPWCERSVLFMFTFSGFISSIITKTRLFKYTEHFNHQKWKFSNKNSDISYTSGQNIDCGYSLEPRRGGSNEYPQSMFFWQK